MFIFTKLTGKSRLA